MKEYTCTICGAKSYSSAEIEHMTEPYCDKCGGAIKESEEHMTNEIALAQRALELAMLISTETTTDAWFEYAGHVDYVSARYSPNGYDHNINNGQTECIMQSDDATVKNLQYIVDCFEFIYAVAERKNV